MTDPERLLGIRASVLLRLAGRGIGSHRVRSTITVAVVALAVAAVVGTTGRTEAARRSLLALLEEPSARLIRVTDRSGEANLGPGAISRLSGLPSVAWVVALSPAGPLGRNAALAGLRGGNAADAVGTRRYWGDLLGGPLVRQVSGRHPRPDEALAGGRAATSLRLADRVGTVDDEAAGPVAVVGSFAAIAPVEDLGSYALVRAADDASDTIGEIMILVRTSAQVEPLVERLPHLIGAEAPVAIERPAELLALRAGLVAEVGDLDAAVLTVSLGSAALLIAAILYGAIEERRREFGLRRSQGATRSTISALVVIESGVLALVGALVGSIVGSLGVANQTGLLPDPALTVAVSVLVILAAIVGSLPPAAVAALREPLYVLRSE
jgi:putative ABC transport system permease protein